MKILFVTMVSLAFAGSAWAGDVEVEWIDADSYSDIEPEYLDDGGDFRDNLFDRFEGYMERLGKRHLDDDVTLKIQVHDWDMAGRVQTQTGAEEGGQPKRYVMDNEYPTMRISYQLLNASGEVQSEGDDIEISGRAIRTEGRSDFPRLSRRDREMIGQEARMFNRWFKEKFIDS
ncbi:DUF3016 domain-containing protein [Aliidiomarina sp. Khilg15.8]